MSAGKAVTFVRVRAEVDFFWVNGKICCEWCNKSFRNKKGHIECCETHEEIPDPSKMIGWYCPAREAIERRINDEVSQP